MKEETKNGTTIDSIVGTGKAEEDNALNVFFECCEKLSKDMEMFFQ